MDVNYAAFGVKHKPKRPNLDFQNFDKIGTRNDIEALYNAFLRYFLQPSVICKCYKNQKWSG